MAQIETYTITVAPSTRPGKVTAHSSDGPSLTTSTPLLDGARYWQALGAPSTAAIVTTWSSGPGHWAQRSTSRIGSLLRFTTRAHHCVCGRKASACDLPIPRLRP